MNGKRRRSWLRMYPATATESTSSPRIAAKSPMWFLIARFTGSLHPLQEVGGSVDRQPLLLGDVADGVHRRLRRRVPAQRRARGGQPARDLLRRGSLGRRQIGDRLLRLAWDVRLERRALAARWHLRLDRDDLLERLPEHPGLQRVGERAAVAEHADV